MKKFEKINGSDIFQKFESDKFNHLLDVRGGELLSTGTLKTQTDANTNCTVDEYYDTETGATSCKNKRNCEPIG